MSFIYKDKFLIILCIILALVIGALLHTIYLQRKTLKSLDKEYKNTINFVNRVFDNIAKLEKVNIQKYFDLTNVQINREKKGGDK